MSHELTDRLLSHLADGRYHPQPVRDLAEALGVKKSDVKAFGELVDELVFDGQVVLSSTHEVTLPPPGPEMVGSFRRHERGFGFIVPDAQQRNCHGDLFVPAGSTGGAMSGDRVRARVIHSPGRGRDGRSPYTGRIVEVIQRADRRYVGNLMCRKRGPRDKNGKWFVVVDGKALSDPVIIRDPGAKNAAEGDKVVVELVRYPDNDEPAEGVIVEVLGAKGEPHVETLAVMRAYNLNEKFDEAVIRDARAAADRFDEDAVDPDREDFTDTFTITIDPPDARDFDDAISLHRLDGGGYELAVHIADVSHFVRPGTAIDDEAQSRGTSTYLPRRVVPMLPELLSNGVCSLQEGVHRYCKSAIMQFDDNGNVTGQRFANCVIKSDKRLTYLEAQALIDGDLREARRQAATSPKYPAPLVDTVKLLDELARVILARRQRAGMIELGLPEVELVYDDAGHVIDAEPEDNAFTHKIIEMFMVEANEAVARLFDALNVPILRRVHADPSSHDVSELRRFARVAGYNIPANPDRKQLQELLNSVRGKPEQQAIHFAVLRTLSKAEYAPLLIGHFALASDHYAHFTSPIRRYPDLTVHRALGAYMQLYKDHRQRMLPGAKGRKKLGADLRRDDRCPSELELVELGRTCSAAERNSESAERQLREYFVLSLLAKHLGEDFDGTVTGATSQGVYIQIDRFLVDGLIRTPDLPGPDGERWRINDVTGALVAQRSGRTITIGDKFTVRIANVHPEARRLDLVIIDSRGAAAKKHQRRQPQGARKAHQKTNRIKQAKNRRRKRR